MAHSFKSNSGNRAFGVFIEPLDAGAYIYNKKAKATYCVTNNCTPSVKVGSESNLLLYKRSNRLTNFPCKNSINKANLDINLITKMNLLGVPVIANFSGNTPTTITSGNTYNIDPDGKLFGNTICGINNYLNYLQYNLPYKAPNYLFNSNL
jgi:hypothetical protein